MRANVGRLLNIYTKKIYASLALRSRQLLRLHRGPLARWCSRHNESLQDVATEPHRPGVVRSGDGDDCRDRLDGPESARTRGLSNFRAARSRFWALVPLL